MLADTTATGDTSGGSSENAMTLDLVVVEVVLVLVGNAVGASVDGCWVGKAVVGTPVGLVVGSELVGTSVGVVVGLELRGEDVGALVSGKQHVVLQLACVSSRLQTPASLSARHSGILKISGSIPSWLYGQI